MKKVLLISSVALIVLTICWAYSLPSLQQQDVPFNDENEKQPIKSKDSLANQPQVTKENE